MPQCDPVVLLGGAWLEARTGLGGSGEGGKGGWVASSHHWGWGQLTLLALGELGCQTFFSSPVTTPIP